MAKVPSKSKIEREIRAAVAMPEVLPRDAESPELWPDVVLEAQVARYLRHWPGRHNLVRLFGAMMAELIERRRASGTVGSDLQIEDGLRVELGPGLAGSKKSVPQIEREIKEAAMTRSGFNRYRGLPPDDALGNPLYKYGAVHAGRLGSYWTTEVDVPATELAGLRPVVQSRSRLRDVASARKAGHSLPPVELAVFRDGSAWIVDGNHRLADARQARLPSVPVVFTFVGS